MPEKPLQFFDRLVKEQNAKDKAFRNPRPAPARNPDAVAAKTLKTLTGKKLQPGNLVKTELGKATADAQARKPLRGELKDLRDSALFIAQKDAVTGERLDPLVPQSDLHSFIPDPAKVARVERLMATPEGQAKIRKEVEAFRNSRVTEGQHERNYRARLAQGPTVAPAHPGLKDDPVYAQQQFEKTMGGQGYKSIQEFEGKINKFLEPVTGPVAEVAANLSPMQNVPGVKDMIREQVKSAPGMLNPLSALVRPIAGLYTALEPSDKVSGFGRLSGGIEAGLGGWLLGLGATRGPGEIIGQLPNLKGAIEDAAFAARNARTTGKYIGESLGKAGRALRDAPSILREGALDRLTSLPRPNVSGPFVKTPRFIPKREIDYWGGEAPNLLDRALKLGKDTEGYKPLPEPAFRPTPKPAEPAPKPLKPAPAEAPVRKEPWQMTSEEYLSFDPPSKAELQQGLKAEKLAKKLEELGHNLDSTGAIIPASGLQKLAKQAGISNIYDYMGPASTGIHVNQLPGGMVGIKRRGTMASMRHESAVYQALSEGKLVLADYPDLQPKAAPVKETPKVLPDQPAHVKETSIPLSEQAGFPSTYTRKDTRGNPFGAPLAKVHESPNGAVYQGGSKEAGFTYTAVTKSGELRTVSKLSLAKKLLSESSKATPAPKAMSQEVADAVTKQKLKLAGDEFSQWTKDSRKKDPIMWGAFDAQNQVPPGAKAAFDRIYRKHGLDPRTGELAEAPKVLSDQAPVEPPKPDVSLETEYKAMRKQVSDALKEPFWQARAVKGGEYGPNGSWYEGGKFIATKPETEKGAWQKLKKLGEAHERSGLAPNETIERAPGAGYTAYSVDPAGNTGELARIPGIRMYDGEPFSQETILEIERDIAEWNDLAAQLNAGHPGLRWKHQKWRDQMIVNTDAFPEYISRGQIARVMLKGELLPENVVAKAKELIPGIDIDKYQELVRWASSREIPGKSKPPAKAPVVASPEQSPVAAIRTAHKGAQKAKTGISRRTGMTKDQEAFIADALVTAAKGEPGKPVSIDVPGDGTFSTETGKMAANLHYAITGKTVGDFKKPSGNKLYKEPPSPEPVADIAVTQYGSPEKAFRSVKAQLAAIANAPEAQYKARPNQVRTLEMALENLVDMDRTVQSAKKNLERQSGYVTEAESMYKSSKSKKRLTALDEARGNYGIAQSELQKAREAVRSSWGSPSKPHLGVKLGDAVKVIDEPSPKPPASPPVEPPAPKPVQLQSGLNPGNVGQAVMEMDRPFSKVVAPPNVTIDKSLETQWGKDFGIHHLVQSPLSIDDGLGQGSIQRGVWERLSPELGKQASDSFQGAKNAINERITRYDTEIADVTANMEQARKASGLNRKAFDEKFIDLIERAKDDPERVAVFNSDTPIGKALRQHDDLTEAFRQSIIEDRRANKIETPDDWGITEQGYFRHLFLGDIWVLDKTAGTVNAASTYAEAEKKVMELLAKNPQAEIVVRAKPIHSMEPIQRVSNGKYFTLVGKIQESVNIPGEVEIPASEVMADLRGIVGRNAAKRKFFGALIQRKGTEGYLKEYEKVMQIHAGQLVKHQELTRLNKEVQPIIERLRKEGKPALADNIQDRLNLVWGTPSKVDILVGNSIKAIPILRNHVSSPAFAFKQLTGMATGLNYMLKLRANPKSWIVNSVQPMMTLWPYSSRDEILKAFAGALDPKLRQMAIERGVLEGGISVESGAPVSQMRKRGLLKADPFRGVSEQNRMVGYAFGVNRAKAQGLGVEAQHASGLAWAEKVEFDNSHWNAPQALTSSTGRLLGQFKGFTIKMLESVGDMARARPGESDWKAAGRLAKFGTAQMGMGGIKSVIPLGVGGGAVAGWLYAKLKDSGMSPEDSKEWTNAIFLGAPELIGLDLSGSLGLMDSFGHSFGEQVLNAVQGPTLGSIGASGIAAYQASQATDPEKKRRAIDRSLGALSPYPRMAEAAYDLATKGNTSIPGPGKNRIQLNQFETVMRALNFQPAKAAKAYEPALAKINGKGTGTGGRIKSLNSSGRIKLLSGN